MVKDGNGHCIGYNEDFKRIIAEGDIVNGLEEGEWHGSLKDSARYVCIYEKGISKKGTGYDKNGKEYPFTAIKKEPTIKGGYEGFLKFLSRNLHYPKSAKENNIQGKVFISFVIEKDGILDDLHVIRGIGGGCDEEAMRVIKLSSPWVPGTQYGMPMRVKYTIPISFTMVTNY
jgi:TonB family protein